MKKKLPIIIVLIAVVALLIIVGISSRDISIKQETAALTADTTVLDKEVPVVGIRLEPTEFKEVVLSTGVLEAWNRTIISSETGGRVLTWNAELGERLTAGQTVLSFDNEVAELQWHQAEAALESAQIAGAKARKDYERQRSLYEKGDLSDNMLEVSELAWKNAEAGLKAAEAAAGLMKRASEETKVRMPFFDSFSQILSNSCSTVILSVGWGAWRNSYSLPPLRKTGLKLGSMWKKWACPPSFSLSSSSMLWFSSKISVGGAIMPP